MSLRSASLAGSSKASSRILLTALLVVAAPGIAAADDAPVEGPPGESVPAEAVVTGKPATTSGALRTGIYVDGDQTVVFRALGAIASSFGHWIVSGSGSVDVISSSSIDVRSSPGLSKVDVTSGASGSSSTSGGKMSDRRLQASAGLGWKDNDGHAATFSASFANETDYNSISGGVNGSFDVHHRMTTLLFGFNYTRNYIGSVLDKSFARQMYELGWSGGVAQVLSQTDAIRLRYDGAFASGYQASPYRNVRFGDWTTSAGPNQRILFVNTLGSPDGLPETEPGMRHRHSLVFEWLHSLVHGLGLHSDARMGIDNWGMLSATAALDLRVVSNNWRIQVGYRFYVQSSADFYREKYTQAASSYSFFTSDKELGREIGHVAHVDLSRVLVPPKYPGDSSLLLDGRLTGIYYSYPDFALLGSRASVFLDIGLTWEL